MTAIHQIQPEIFVLTPKGEGIALFLLDYGATLNTVWLVHIFSSGEVLHFESTDIRIRGNYTWNVSDPAPFRPRSSNGTATS